MKQSSETTGSENSRRHYAGRTKIGAAATAAVLLAGGGFAAGRLSSGEGPSASNVRAAAAQEAMYYDEATYVAGVYESQLRAGKKTNLPYLNGKITDKANVSGTAKEYGPINNPIFLVPGQASRDGLVHNDSDLDGGFVGVQSTDATGQVSVEVVPFDKESMHFDPANPSAKEQVTFGAEVEVKQLKGSVRGNYAVSVNSVTNESLRNGDDELIIPGFAPNQSS